LIGFEALSIFLEATVLRKEFSRSRAALAPDWSGKWL